MPSFEKVGLYWIWSVLNSEVWKSGISLLFFGCVTVSSGTTEARILKLGIHVDNELLYGDIENQAHCSYSSFYLSIFLSVQVNLCHSFLRNSAIYNLQTWHTYGKWVIESYNSDSARCPYFSIFFSSFFLSLCWVLTLKLCVTVFSATVKARILNICVCMDNDLLYGGIDCLAHCSYSSFNSCIFLSFQGKCLSQFSH